MKLRILDNSIRLRLLKSEVDRLDQDGALFSETILPGSRFKYSLSASGSEFRISHNAEGLEVIVPSETLSSWAHSNRVGFRNSFELKDGSKCTLLVEKDFKCLSDAEGADQSDFYENPYAKEKSE